jgi:hypothetical protein
MSGGRKIDDHSFWAGGPGKESVLPDGPHKSKPEKVADSAGELNHYEDTTETIRSQQEKSQGQAKKYPMKTGYRG